MDEGGVGRRRELASFSTASSLTPSPPYHHTHTHSFTVGAAIGAVDADGQTPLHKAAAGGHAGVCRALLTAPGGVASLTVRDRRGRTPAEVAEGEGVRAALLGGGGW